MAGDKIDSGEFDSKTGKLKDTKSFLDTKISEAKDALAQNAKALRTQVDKAGQSLVDAVPESIKLQVKLVSALNKGLSQKTYEELAKAIQDCKTQKEVGRTVAKDIRNLAGKIVANHIKQLRDNLKQLQKLNPTFDVSKYVVEITDMENGLFSTIATTFGEAGEKIARANGVTVNTEKWERKNKMTLGGLSKYKNRFKKEDRSETDIYKSMFEKSDMSELQLNLSDAQADINYVKKEIQASKNKGDNVAEEEAKLKEEASEIYKMVQDRLLELYVNKSHELEIVTTRGLDENTIYSAEEIIEELETFNDNAAKIFDFLKQQKVDTGKTKQRLESAKKANKMTEAVILAKKLEIHEGTARSINLYGANNDDYETSSNAMPDTKGMNMMIRLIEIFKEATDPNQKYRASEIANMANKLKEQVRDFIERFEEAGPDLLDQWGKLTTMNKAALQSIDFFKFLERNKYITRNESQRLEAKIKGTLEYEIAQSIRVIVKSTKQVDLADIKDLIDVAEYIGMNVKKYKDQVSMLEKRKK